MEFSGISPLNPRKEKAEVPAVEKLLGLQWFWDGGKLVGKEEREGGWGLHEGTTGQDSWGEAQPLPGWTHPNREGGSRGGGWTRGLL